jgi:thiol-disulfide isomerase/thioredoxin
MKIIENIESYQDFLTREKIALGYYYTPTCGICKVLEPRVQLIVEKLDIPSFEVNLVEMPSLGAQQLIMGVPTFVVYVDGKEQWREGAYVQFPEFEKRLSELKAGHLA